MHISVAVIIAAGIALFFYMSSVFDHIVKAEYQLNKVAWEEDDRPMGFFWRAPESTYFRSSWARNRLLVVWLFTTPKWAEDSTDCHVWLNRLRISVLGWFILVLALFSILSS